MPLLRKIASGIRSLFQKKRADRELDEELRGFMEMAAEESMKQGRSQKDALRAVRLERGSLETAKERVRSAGWESLLETLWQDLSYGLRMLRKSLGFSAVAILTLAIGIGANTAIFSVVNTVLLRPLPAKNPSQLVLLGWRASERYVPNLHFLMFYGACSMEGFGVGPQGHVASAVYTGCSFSEPLLHEIEQANIFSGVGAFADLGRTYLSGIGSATTVYAEAISGGFFHAMGIKASAGRLIEPTDDTLSSAPVAVLSYGFWQSAFGGSREAIGRVIEVRGMPLTIVGVAEPGFTGITPGSNFELWLPLSDWSPGAGRQNRVHDARAWWLTIVGRLKPGERRAQAQAAISGLLGNEIVHGANPLFIAREEPGRVPGGTSRPTASTGGEPELTLASAQTGLMGYRGLYANPLYVLLFAVGIVLLISCTNVAGLMLARVSAREKEMAVRLALGAGRGRLVRQLLTESVTLSLLGGALGILMAYVGAHVIVSFVRNVQLMVAGSADPMQLRIQGFTAVDPRILGFTLALTLLTGILFGLAPAFRNARVDLTPALKEGARGAVHSSLVERKWPRMGDVLVVGQVALAVIVLAGAGLLVRTLKNLRDINLGFETRHVLSFGIWTPPTLSGKQEGGLNQELERHLAEIPGVESVSNTTWPLLMNGGDWIVFHWPGRPADEESETGSLEVGPNFFSTMHIPLLAGRAFSAADFEVAVTNESTKLPQAPVAVIVNQEFVAEFVGKGNPLGVRFGEHGPTTQEPASTGYEIVGVVGNARLYSPRQRISPLIYEPSRGSFFELRTAVDPKSIAPGVRKIVAQVNPDVAVFDVTTESAQIDQLLFRERLMARLSGFFALLAMVLACIGLYGLLSYETSQRTHEIGIRMAIGAQPKDVLKLLLGKGAVLAIVGVLAGIAVAASVTRYLGSLLYGVKPGDPATFIAVAVLLVLVALAACHVPVRRAMRVDPIIALKYE
ncbi:MAG TPA: ABC transporter permease [Candidatus Solibacter sp.]|nr:ABC transporter permease [Candidatus Solibacter sp.]